MQKIDHRSSNNGIIIVDDTQPHTRALESKTEGLLDGVEIGISERYITTLCDIEDDNDVDFIWILLWIKIIPHF